MYVLNIFPSLFSLMISELFKCSTAINAKLRSNEGRFDRNTSDFEKSLGLFRQPADWFNFSVRLTSNGLRLPMALCSCLHSGVAEERLKENLVCVNTPKLIDKLFYSQKYELPNTSDKHLSLSGPNIDEHSWYALFIPKLLVRLWIILTDEFTSFLVLELLNRLLSYTSRFSSSIDYSCL